MHETLSQTFDEQVDFDEVADRLAAMVTEVSSESAEVEINRDGVSFGQLPAEMATPLAMVLTEICRTPSSTAFAGRPGVGSATGRLRAAGRLHITVDDDGRGLPADFDPVSSGNLGLSIVRTLVESELGGVLSLGASPAAGRGSTWTSRCTL